MNEKIVDIFFPGTAEKVKEGICPVCNGKVGQFRDRSSEKEYRISGMCQACQDKTFGVD